MTTTTRKPTLTTQVADLTAAVQALLAAQAQPQFATPAPVAETVDWDGRPVTTVVETVAPVTKASKVEKPVVVTASDVLKTHVESQGLAFAKGGRTVLNTDMLKAALRVLKTGTPEVLPVGGRLAKRGVSHIAIGKDGENVVTQYVFTPER